MKNLLIVLAVVIIIGAVWYAISNRPSQHAAMDMKNMTSGAASTEEAVVCPVTGEKMAKSKAYTKVEYKGKTYYMCCSDCVGKFKKNPEKYIKN